MSKSFPITGIGKAGRGPKGEIPLRREIDEWWFNQDINTVNQKSLFIYALHNFQQQGLGQPDDLSYIGIAGIHGLPLTPWPKTNSKKTFWYCTHGKTTFSTWHTPYMLLYEQRLYEEMRKLIPSTFDAKDHEAMYHAADTWRLPFWDFARKKPSWDDKNPTSPKNNPENVTAADTPNVPYLLTQTHVQVRAKAVSGGLATVANPMFNFAVPKGKVFGDYNVLYTDDYYKEHPKEGREPWIPTVRVTSRWPDLPKKMNAAVWEKQVTVEQKAAYSEGLGQNWKKIETALKGEIKVYDRSVDPPKLVAQANTLPESVLRLYKANNGKSIMNFRQFSTSSYRPAEPTEGIPSLEAIHNNIHNFTGGSGYMGDPATSAFDPIFWLHHCNVDRLLAMWQTLFAEQYGEWLKSTAEPKDNSQTPLIPFCKDDQSTAYKSTDSSLKFDEFGYAYPELQRWKYDSDEAYLQSIREAISSLYATTAPTVLLLKSNKQARQAVVKSVSPEDLITSFVPPVLVEEAAAEPAVALTASDGAQEDISWEHDDYVVNVVYERFAYGGKSFAVVIYLGDVPADNSPDFSHYTAVGEVYNFSAPSDGRGFDEQGCESCKEQEANGALYSGQVILTDALVEKIVRGEPQRNLTLQSLDREEVIPYLRSNLHWRIVDVFGTNIPKEEMQSVSVSVATAKVTNHLKLGRQSDFGPYETLWEVTQNRRAGAASTDQYYFSANA